MKSSSLALIISAVAMLATGLAQAEARHKSGHQNLSKRPYHQPVERAATTQAGDFEGATLVRDEVSDADKAASKQQDLMRLNQLSKRPY